jgi:glycosyltransferase involved in cell wall biosynthesis
MSGITVGLLCHLWYPEVGGIESHTRDLARELVARGHRVRAMCLDYTEGREPYSVREEEVEGVVVRRMAYLYQDLRALADMVENPRAEKAVEEWLEAGDIELLHVQHATGWGIGVLRVAKRAGIPAVMTLHDYWPLCPRGQMMRSDHSLCEVPDPGRCGSCLAATWSHLLPSGEGEARGPGGGVVESDEEAAGARTAFALECLGEPDRMLTPSAATRAVYARAGVDPRRIEVCENGIEVAELAAEVARLREQGERSDGEVRLGVLGTVLPSKGVLELARAVIDADVPRLALEIHGHLPPYHGDSSYVEQLRELAERDGRIRVHGPFPPDGLPETLAGLDGVAAPSRWVEVYGLTVREAAAAGLPVLVSDAGDLAAVTDGGRAGVVVPIDDHDRWVEVLQQFARDSEARRRWGSATRKLHRTAEMVDQIEAAYLRVMPRSPGLFRRILGQLIGRLVGRGR